MTDQGNKMITIQVPLSLYKEIQTIAAEKRVPMSEIIREQLIKMVKSGKKAADYDQRQAPDAGWEDKD